MAFLRWSPRAVGHWLLAALGSGCMLGNIDAEPCGSDGACEQRFGLGSTCNGDGYCSEPAACSRTIECRARFGVGATCDGAQCVVAPPEPRCTLSEPAGLSAELPGTLGDRILLGGLFAFDEEKHRVRADAARLAVRQVNDIAGGIQGRPLGLLLCNSDSDGNSANDEQEVRELTTYLASTLGLPVVLGPTSSANSITATNTLLQQEAATVLVSPSATSHQLTDLPDRLADDDPYGLFWRTCPSDTLQGPVIARVIGGRYGLPQVASDLDKIAVIYQNDAYGSGLQFVFRTEFTGLDPAQHEIASFAFAIDESDLAGAVADASSFAPAAVLVVSSDAARTIQVLEAASQAAGLRSLPFFLTDGSKDAAVLLSSSNAPGVQDIVRLAIGTAPASPQGSTYNSFSDALRYQFDGDASQFSFVAHSYDAAFIATYGVVFAETMSTEYDGLHVAEGLSHLSAGPPLDVGPNTFSSALSALQSHDDIDITGISGSLQFDASTGEAPGDIQVWAPCDPSAGSCPSQPVPGTELVFEQLLLVSADDL